jgi:hypothetical protein
VENGKVAEPANPAGQNGKAVEHGGANVMNGKVAGPERPAAQNGKTVELGGAKKSEKAPKAADPAPQNGKAEKEPLGNTVEDPLRDIVDRAVKGDRDAVPELRKALAEHPEQFRDAGDLALITQKLWLDMFAGENLYLRETVERKLAEMRRELAEVNSSPLEKLLIERVVACWLQVHEADTLITGNQETSEAIRKELLHRQEGAQRRFFDAVKRLAQLRKLLPAKVMSKYAAPAAQCAESTTVANNVDSVLATQPVRPANAGCDDPLLAASVKLANGKPVDDPLVVNQTGNAETSVDADAFPRISKDREAEALVNGVAVVN